ncbi:MAG: SpoIIE family protein phosphatase [Oscillospiraceae bacterium]|nr:SpoIIE family protein phosphatase [Oscillospiraceae bacterium]
MELGGRGKLKMMGRVRTGETDPRFYIALRGVIYMGMGMLMSCGRVLQNGAPFGMAMVACSGAGISGVCALVGASAGYLLSGGLGWGIRYIAACVLVYTIAFVFQELSFYKQEYFMPTASGIVMALTGFLGNMSSSNGALPMYAEIFLETSLAFGSTYFFHEALSGETHTTETAELKHSVAVMIMAACALMAFARVELFSLLSVGRFLSLLLVMSSAMKGGMFTGAAVGTVLGLAMDICRMGHPFYAMAYAFSGLLSGVFGKHGRFIFALSFLLAGALSVVGGWDEELYISALLEFFSACCVFLLLPGAFLNQVGMLLQPAERGSGETGLRRFVAGRVKNLSLAYSELYETVRKNVEQPYNDENIARVFDRAADEVCVRCRYKNRCWNNEYMDTLSAMNDATHAMSENGSLHVNDLPGFFRERCTSLPAFVASVNAQLRSLAYRRRLREHLRENRSIAWAQLADISQILSTVADELGSKNGSDPLAEKRLTKYLRTLDIDADTAVYRDGSGRTRVVIESGRLTPLTRSGDYLDKLSSVVGVRLCQPLETEENGSRLTLLEAEPLAVSVGIAAMKKRGEKVSGDKGTYFKTDSGILCVILSDGMGTGSDAARDSDQAVSILEKFLRSGIDPAVSMKILNSVMLLKSAESWGYATVDLMCVNLFTGDTCFYKYGAAPSYVFNGKTVKRIKGESLAAGLGLGEGMAPDLVRMRLKPGCTAIIASDGVIADAEDEWIKALLNKGFEDMKALARSTLKEAEKLYGANDDMTVLTVRVEERP